MPLDDEGVGETGCPEIVGRLPTLLIARVPLRNELRKPYADKLLVLLEMGGERMDLGSNGKSELGGNDNEDRPPAFRL